MGTGIKKVLVIGSGPIVIGQAAEFDYAGVQACRTLKKEKIEIVLINSNPATIMTDENIADKVYIEPLNIETLEKIIQKERPQGMLAALGGQTALNLACELSDKGILEKYNVKLLGTDIDAIKLSENRALFKDLMSKNGLPILQGKTVCNSKEAFDAIEEIGFPVVIRPAFTLGGVGGSFVYNKDEFEKALTKGFDASLIHQVLLEKSVVGFKEIEYEIIRDGDDNCIVVCNMENIDAMGIHTGDSMVVAPAQTLTDKQLLMFKEASFKIIRALKIKGGCNIQYALNPDNNEFYVIEVNPRVSRSSALASKATGFPIAKITTKIAIGYKLTDFSKNLDDIQPKLDYIVVKIPKFSFDKFKGVDRNLTTQMKATGEVMALGKTFEEAFRKALFSTENRKKNCSDDISITDDLRIYRIFEALKNGKSTQEISKVTHINEFFIKKFKEMLPLTSLDCPYYYSVKPYCDTENLENSYFYSSSKKENFQSIKNEKNKKVLVIGSGPIRIGQGIEFDYCSVHCALEVQKCGYDAIIINSNPETLSTDYDISTRLYFEPLTANSVMSVINYEKPDGVIVQFGGQTAINIAEDLKKYGINILGSTLKSINITEDRECFSDLLDELNIPRAKGYSVISVNEALYVAEELSYPVVIRPSYTIGGFGVKIAKNLEELKLIVEEALLVTQNHAILIDEYIEGTEAEADVICDGSEILMTGILEHIEKTGVHSGDSIAIYPSQNILKEQKELMFSYAQKISEKLNLKGLMNIQYIIKNEKIYVLEVNPRASRTVPILSKITGIPICKIAVDIMLNKSLKESGYKAGLYPEKELFAIKMPIYSFDRLPNADKTLSTEMKSTGEVLGVDFTYSNAMKKAFIMAGYDFKNDNFFENINTNSIYEFAKKNFISNKDLNVETITKYRTH